MQFLAASVPTCCLVLGYLGVCCITTRASLLHLMDELTKLAHGSQSQRWGNSCTRETCWALPRFVMSSISTHKSNVGEKDRQTDQPTIFFCEIPQSSALPFTPQARFVFSSVQFTKVSQLVTVKLITKSVASSFSDNSFPPICLSQVLSFVPGPKPKAFLPCSLLDLLQM